MAWPQVAIRWARSRSASNPLCVSVDAPWPGPLVRMSAGQPGSRADAAPATTGGPPPVAPTPLAGAVRGVDRTAEAGTPSPRASCRTLPSCRAGRCERTKAVGGRASLRLPSVRHGTEVAGHRQGVTLDTPESTGRTAPVIHRASSPSEEHRRVGHVPPGARRACEHARLVPPAARATSLAAPLHVHRQQHGRGAGCPKATAFFSNAGRPCEYAMSIVKAIIAPLAAE